MGKYGIGARVRHTRAESGTVIDKAKGIRCVRFDGDDDGIWCNKHALTPLPANDDAPATQERANGKFKVGDRVTGNSTVVSQWNSYWSEKYDFTASADTVFVIHSVLPNYVDGAPGYEIATLDGHVGPYWTGRYLTPAPEWQPKVGERVRVKQHRNWFGDVLNFIEPGSEVELTGLLDDGDFDVPEGETWTAFTTNTTNWVRSDDLEPLPVAAEAQGAGAETASDKWVPEVGERVRCIDNNGSPNRFKVGEIYTVREVDDPAPGHDNWLVYVEENGSAMFGFRFEPAPLTIETGKFYKTRDGRKVGPMEEGKEWPFRGLIHGESHAAFEYNGTCPFYPRFDLIAEWVDELAEPTPTIGSTVTLATPGVITGHNGPNVSVALPQGSYDLPLAALVSA